MFTYNNKGPIRWSCIVAFSSICPIFISHTQRFTFRLRRKLAIRESEMIKWTWENVDAEGINFGPYTDNESNDRRAMGKPQWKWNCQDSLEYEARLIIPSRSGTKATNKMEDGYEGDEDSDYILVSTRPVWCRRIIWQGSGVFSTWRVPCCEKCSSEASEGIIQWTPLTKSDCIVDPPHKIRDHTVDPPHKIRLYSGPPSQNQGQSKELARENNSHPFKGLGCKRVDPLTGTGQGSGVFSNSSVWRVPCCQKRPSEASEGIVYLTPPHELRDRVWATKKLVREDNSLPFEYLSRKRVDPDWTASNCPQQ